MNESQPITTTMLYTSLTKMRLALVWKLAGRFEYADSFSEP